MQYAFYLVFFVIKNLAKVYYLTVMRDFHLGSKEPCTFVTKSTKSSGVPNSPDPKTASRGRHSLTVIFVYLTNQYKSVTEFSAAFASPK